MTDRDKILLVVVLAAFGGLAVWTWHSYAQDSHDTNWWGDPHQPPTNIDTQTKVVPQNRLCTREAPFVKEYPSSLTEWNGSVIGSF